MLTKLRFFVVAFLSGLLLCSASHSAGLISIGTGGVTGVYFPTGGGICNLINRSLAEEGTRCFTKSTSGSVENLELMRNGALDFVVAQADWQYHAFNGTSHFKDEGAFRDLRSVFSIYDEAFTVVAREDANIKRFSDLQGKRVNVGDPGSGQRATMEVVMDAMGWTMKDFSPATELRALEQASALCRDRIDAMVYVVGHPAGAIREATTACQSKLVPVEGDAISKLIADNDYYKAAEIPGHIYRGQESAVKTFSVGSALVTSATVPDETVYTLVKTVFEHFESFKRMHPAFKKLTPEHMITKGLIAPLHPGALRYYKERGWM